MTSVRRRPRGFSLVELVVTVLVLGIILGIAVVSWDSQVRSSQMSAAGSLLDRVTTIEQPIARDWGSYTSWPSDLSDVGSDVQIANGRSSAASNQVSVVVGSTGTLALAVKVSPGVCLFRLVAPLNAGGGSSIPTGIPSSASCTGQSALPVADPPVTQTASIRGNGN